MIDEPITIVGGYTCERCGMWVSRDTFHFCTKSQWDDPKLITVLERIADALEKIAGNAK